jgi:predicted membrane protein
MMPLLDVLAALLVVAIIARLIHTRIAVPGNLKSILDVVLALIVVGIVLWLINTYVPMAGSIKAILNIVVVIATCVGVLQAVGLWTQIEKLWDDLIHNRKPV